MFEGKSILITGGTGSFGQAFTRYLIENCKPQKVIIFSRDELKQAEMAKRFDAPEMRYFIGDVRDVDRLTLAFEDVDYVVHAAAMKQVPACEYNVMEAIKTNITGTMNVLSAALSAGIEKAILLSSDKACIGRGSRVRTLSGRSLPVEGIVKSRSRSRIVSLDGTTLAEKEVSGWFENTRSGRRIARLSYADAPFISWNRTGVYVTEDHPVLTVDGWKSVASLSSEDHLIIAEPVPNERQLSFLVGTLLGDANLSRGAKAKHQRYVLTFSQVSGPWLTLKMQALDGFSHGKISTTRPRKRDRRPSHRVSFAALTAWSRLAKEFYVSGEKIVPRELFRRTLKDYPAELLCAWYLDDGFRTKKDNHRHNPVAVLSTHGFTVEDVEWLVDELRNQGLQCSAIPVRLRSGVRRKIQFTREASRKLWTLIERGVPDDLQYKMDLETPRSDNTFWNLGSPNLLESAPLVTWVDPSRFSRVYNLAIDDTQNFVVSGIILHNCSPINLYGATKMVAERLFVHGNVYVGDRGYPQFSVVRYGNVVGSRGSVIPLFLEQAKTGRLTITDTRMTRFWMTLERACKLVVDALENAYPGEIAIPSDLPAMSVVQLAAIIAPQAKLMFSGIRPGEKLHESLISPHEIPRTYRRGDTYVVIPESSPLGLYYGMEQVPSDFEYTSQTVTPLHVVDVIRMISDLPEAREWKGPYTW